MGGNQLIPCPSSDESTQNIDPSEQPGSSLTNRSARQGKMPPPNCADTSSRVPGSRSCGDAGELSENSSEAENRGKSEGSEYTLSQGDTPTKVKSGLKRCTSQKGAPSQAADSRAKRAGPRKKSSAAANMNNNNSRLLELKSMLQSCNRKVTAETKAQNKVHETHGKEVDDLKLEITEFKRKAAERDAQVERMERKFDDARQESMSFLSKREGNVNPDEDMITWADEAVGRYQNWIRRYAARSQLEWTQMTSILVGVLGGHKGSKKWASGRCVKLAEQGRLSVRTVLMAATMRFSVINMLSDCFFWLRGHDSEEDETSFFLRINRLSRTMNQEDLTMWRSLTMQILSPSDSDLSSCPIHKDITQRKQTICAAEADRILEAYNVLLEPLTEGEAAKRRDELIGSIRGFETFSRRLHAQNVTIKILASKQDLANFGEKTFSSRSDLMSPHASLQMHDKGDTSRDGSAIDLVVQPAIVAISPKRSEFDRGYRVWLKAVVWMAEEGIEAATNSPPEEPPSARSKSVRRGSKIGNPNCVDLTQCDDEGKPTHEGSSFEPQAGEVSIPREPSTSRPKPLNGEATPNSAEKGSAVSRVPDMADRDNRIGGSNSMMQHSVGVGEKRPSGGSEHFKNGATKRMKTKGE